MNEEQKLSWRAMMAFGGSLFATSVVVAYAMVMVNKDVWRNELELRRQYIEEADSTLQAQIDQINDRLNSRWGPLAPKEK